jgi:chloramphenicol 3-O phosphotransferase
MSQGRVIILNGTSSSGKTTIANLLHGTLLGPCLRTGIDDYLDRVGRYWVEVGDGLNQQTAPGWLAVVRDGRLVEVRTGPVGQRVLSAMYASVAGAARSGLDVVVDDVIHEATVLESAITHLRELPVAFVGIKCSLDVAERRE